MYPDYPFDNPPPPPPGGPVPYPPRMVPVTTVHMRPVPPPNPFPPPPGMNPAVAVDRMLGDSYYVVKTVFLHLPFLRALGDTVDNIYATFASLEPYLEAIQTNADNIDKLIVLGQNAPALLNISDHLQDIEIIVDDLDSRETPNVIDYGRINDGNDSIWIAGGKIVTVAGNINSVVTVANGMPTLTALEQELSGADDTIATMRTLKNQTVNAANQAAADKAASTGAATAAQTASGIAVSAGEDALYSKNVAEGYKDAAVAAKEAAEAASAQSTQCAQASCACATRAEAARDQAEAIAQCVGQSDWQEWNVNKSSYIKNRTHYIKYTVQEVYETILDTEQFTRLPDDKSAALSEYVEIDPSKTYRITFDGTVYRDIGRNFLKGQGVTQAQSSGCAVCDAAHPYVPVADFAVYPFALFMRPCKDTTDVFTQTAGLHTIKIEEVGVEAVEDGVVQLDPKYLPPATASTVGAVKIGDGLSVTSDGTLSVSFDSALHVNITGQRGDLAGYSNADNDSSTGSETITIDSKDVIVRSLSGATTVAFTASSDAGITSTKVIVLKATDTSALTFTGATWCNNITPPASLSSGQVLVLTAFFAAQDVFLNVYHNSAT